MLMWHPDTENLGDASRYAKGWQFAKDLSPNELEARVLNYAVSPCMWWPMERKKANFRKAYWLGLDFDDGLPLDAALEIFEPYLHVIGITRSHQKQKGDKPPSDRYRVFLRFSELITSSEVYESTMKQFVQILGCDESAVDTARFFWPCSQIIRSKYYGKVIDPVDLETVKAKQMLALERRRQREAQRNLEMGGRYVPAWVRLILENGALPGTRNQSVFSIAAKLSELGYAETDIISMVLSSPLPTADFSEIEIRRTIANGRKKVLK